MVKEIVMTSKNRSQIIQAWPEESLKRALEEGKAKAHA
jgi:hypothetical protein